MRAEFAVFKTELGAPSVLAGKVYTAFRETSAGEPVRENYVIATPNLPDFDDERFTAPQTYQSKRLCEFDVRFVATSTDGVMLLAEAAFEHLLFRVLTVPGRVCDPIRVDRTANDRTGVLYDKTARLFYLDTTFTFISRSA